MSRTYLTAIVNVTNTQMGHILSTDPEFTDVCALYYAKQVAVTNGVYQLIKGGGNRPLEVAQDVLGDILWMSKNYVIQRLDESTRLFQVVVYGAPVPADHPMTTG